MTPQQTIIMVICWMITPAITAALIAVPAGLTLQDGSCATWPATAVRAQPAQQLRARPRHRGPALLALGGLAIAAAGALGPATWAATAETTTALRTE